MSALCHRRMITSMTAALAVMLASAQWQFELDTTFRTMITRVAVSSLLPRPDGTLVASGRMRSPNELSDRTLVQLMPDGQRNEAFYNSGLGGGKIIPWSGNIYVGNGGIVRRIILPSGTNDRSFRLGYLPPPYFASVQGGDYHVYPDGRVLMSGAHMLSDSIRGFQGMYNLIWFTNTGYLDTTKVHRAGNNVVYRFKELADGKFICSGTCTEFEGEEVEWIFRVNADGSTDTTFRTGAFWGGAQGYLPMADGRCYVAGNFRRNQDPDDTLRVVRFLPDGSLDPNFNIPHFALNGLYNHGLGISPSGLGATAWSMSPWEGGRTIVTGYFGSVNGQTRGGICMLDSTGVVLDAFDDCWASPFNYQNTSYGGILGFVPAGDGEHYYIHGSYKGYADGTTNDTLQRFVSRLIVEDLSTQLASMAAAIDLQIYPNPTSGTISLTLEELQPGTWLSIRDQLGRELLRRSINDLKTTLDLNTLHDGCYNIQIRANGTYVASKRLLVAH